MTEKQDAKSGQTKIDLEKLIFAVIEKRGYLRQPDVPSMNNLIYEKVKHLYVAPPKRR
jgi:hypothetical protein